MKIAQILALLVALQNLSLCNEKQETEETKSKDHQIDQLWRNGKITPEQPFPAKVIGVGGNSPWAAGVQIYLQEIGKQKRLCLAFVSFGQKCEYTLIEKRDFDRKKLVEKSLYDICFFEPAVGIENFVWCHMGLIRVGRIFEEKDGARIGLLREIENQLFLDKMKRDEK